MVLLFWKENQTTRKKNHNMSAKALQGFLRKKSVEALQNELKINVKVHSEYSNLYQFKYDQIETPMGHEVSQQCRGIILDKDNDWNPVCHTFNKFFNTHEVHAAEVDWSTAKVYEKCDGSLMQLSHYDNKWHVSTTGSPDAGGNVGDHGFTFKELFWETWKELGYDHPRDKNISFAFELCTKYNRIVVNHEKPRIVFLGARHNKYGYELWPRHIGQFYNWETVRQFDFYSPQEVAKALDGMQGVEQEGFVVVDTNFNRVKMKCEDYVLKHRFISSVSTRNLLDLVRQNEGQEFLSYFKEWQKEYDVLKEIYENLVKEIESEYDKHKHIKDQKEFALAIKKNKFSGCMFQLRSGKINNVREGLCSMNIKHLEEIIEKRMNK